MAVLKRDRVRKFLVEHPGTYKMPDIFKLVEDGLAESVRKHTVRKVVKKLATKNGAKRWATWTIIPDYPDEEMPVIPICIEGTCCPACESIVK